jgi:hypothetical protein
MWAVRPYGWTFATVKTGACKAGMGGEVPLDDVGRWVPWARVRGRARTRLLLFLRERDLGDAGERGSEALCFFDEPHQGWDVLLDG